MSHMPQIRGLWEKGIARRVRMSSGSSRRPPPQSPSSCRWPWMDVEREFDEYVLACVLSRALEEIDAGEATVTEATGLSRTELREIINCGFPAVCISAFSLEEASDPAIGAEEELLRGMLFAHALVGDVASARFAKIIARRALRDDDLWQELGLCDPVQLSRLLATHFPKLASGNTQNMRWKNYLYRTLYEAEGFSPCTAASCHECRDFKGCFGAEEGKSGLVGTKGGVDLD
ncbi:nitrogen fixation protein NifQ 1 (plasmid) [Rhizobium etli]|uniref:Nitrogen fixation protein NifQ 1 n=1 Tax=Rhizobium etli TaxID=29449 RepID=A0AAN1BMU9_RHIET|nr:nitrogen fixation protein NifQ [Rhizobium etli]ARQ13366.1 nitrogen fixation protein NifQ 1 [Rhizobium etli]